ncbi:TonB-dependent receptor [bacterium]|nr:TonB-dependent receptor [bacterium]
MCKLTSYTITAFIILWILAFARMTRAEELPRIELPAYIISGVEKATTLRGTRLPTTVESSLSIPGSVNSIRPKLTSIPVWQPPSKPSLIVKPVPGYWRADTRGGAFRLFGLNGSLINAEQGVSRRGTIAYLQPPHRIAAGFQSGWRIQYDEVRYLGENTAIQPRISFTRREYTLLVDTSDYKSIRSDLALNLLVQSFHTSIGSFTGRLHLSGMNYSSKQDLSGFHGQLDGLHCIALGEGFLESGIFYGSESIDTDDDRLQLARLSIKYRMQPRERIVVSVGGSAYLGNDISGVSVQGVRPQLEIESGLPFDGTVSLKYNPLSRLVSYRDELSRSPVLDSEARGYISEEIDRLSLDYNYNIASSLVTDVGFSIGGFLTDARHIIFAVPDSAGKWYPSARRLSSRGLELDCYYNDVSGVSVNLHMKYEEAQTDGFETGDQAPQIPKTSVTVSTAFPMSLFTLRNGLEWSGESPVDFEGEGYRPDRLIWNASVDHEFNRGIGVEVGVENILNVEYYDYPRYDMPPLTVYIGFYFGNNWRER